jgi:hypothetical protein
MNMKKASVTTASANDAAGTTVNSMATLLLTPTLSPCTRPVMLHPTLVTTGPLPLPTRLMIPVAILVRTKCYTGALNEEWVVDLIETICENADLQG